MSSSHWAAMRAASAEAFIGKGACDRQRREDRALSPTAVGPDRRPALGRPCPRGRALAGPKPRYAPPRDRYHSASPCPTPRSTWSSGPAATSGAISCRRCWRKGRRVRAAARQRKVLEAREWHGAELVEADALKPAFARRRAARRRHRLLPRAFDGGGPAVRRAGPGSGRELRRRRRALRGAPDRLPRRPDPAACRFRAPALAQGDRRQASRGQRAGHRAARRHHRGAGQRRLRGHARPRLPPARDGDAALGAVEVLAGGHRQPRRVPDPRRGAAAGPGTHPRRRAARSTSRTRT